MASVVVRAYNGVWGVWPQRGPGSNPRSGGWKPFQPQASEDWRMSKFALVELNHTLACRPICSQKCYVRWSMSPMCLIDEHSALPDRTVCRFLHSNCQPSAVECFWLQLHGSGTGFLAMSRRLIRCQLFSSNWNTLCSSSHSQTLLCDIFLTVNTHSGPSSGITTWPL